ncbi:MAG: helix-turn-helix domain-containing protein [Candidatus Obscuribacterales bacterium]|nr:helix-turn-helix domain-containing protein [Candidatus Obscuribacterales bacterium]
MATDWHKNLYRCLGTVISMRRRKLGLSQEELAEQSGVDRAFISNLENGKRKPSFGAIANIAHGLRMRYARLVHKCEECLENENCKSA